VGAGFLGMQSLLGCGLRGSTRRELLGELGRVATGGGSYANSCKELTPVCIDWLSAVPLMLLTLILLVRRQWTHVWPRRLGAQVPSARSIQLIEREVAV
jgi:hypothetical protein